jgi:hypothetical protein
MNQNDMERYFWRTGQRWGAGGRGFQARWRPRKASNRAIFLLFAAFSVTVAMLLALR